MFDKIYFTDYFFCMKSQKIILSSIIVFLLIVSGVGYFIFQDSTDSEDSSLNEQVATTDQSSEQVASNQDAGTFTEYDENLLANAEDGDVVLFFKASWCITCKSLERNILKEQDQIPADLTIMTLDYDEETKLKEKYKVSVQHTLVQVDANGDLIARWVGGNTLETITDQIL